MNELATRAIEEDAVKWLGQFPEGLMEEGEQEYVSFVLEYNQKHGKPPSLKRVMEDFDFFIPYIFESTLYEPLAPPISDIFDQTVQRKLLMATERHVRAADTVLRREGRVPMEVFAEIEKLHTMSLGVAAYSTFDRDLYFRRRSLTVPFKIIDNLTGGLSNGDFMLIIGRLGSGKSTLAQFIAKELWLQGKKILYVSAEMLSLDVFSRIDAMVGRFNPLDLRKGRTGEMVDLLGRTLKKVKEEDGEIIIPRSRLLSPQQIASFAKNLDVDLVVVDGAYLLKPSDGFISSKWEKVAAVSNELKQMALDLNMPLIATSQIKRGADGDDGFTPEDISYSDALGQDSDFVLAVHPNKILKERLELQLIKNRYGALGGTQISIEWDTMTIVEDSAAALSAKEKVDYTEWIRK